MTTRLLDRLTPAQKAALEKKVATFAINAEASVKQRANQKRKQNRQEEGYLGCNLQIGDKFKQLASWKNKSATTWTVLNVEQKEGKTVIQASSSVSAWMKIFTFKPNDEVKLISHAN